MTHARDAWVVGRGDAVALRLVVHGAELADSERFAFFTDAPLEEKYGSFRVNFDEQGNDEQRQEEHNKPHERHDAVEAPLEKESYFAFIFHHAAWLPCSESP